MVVMLCRTCLKLGCYGQGVMGLWGCGVVRCWNGMGGGVEGMGKDGEGGGEVHYVPD